MPASEFPRLVNLGYQLTILGALQWRLHVVVGDPHIIEQSVVGHAGDVRKARARLVRRHQGALVTAFGDAPVPALRRLPTGREPVVQSGNERSYDLYAANGTTQVLAPPEGRHGRDDLSQHVLMRRADDHVQTHVTRDAEGFGLPGIAVCEQQ